MRPGPNVAARSLLTLALPWCPSNPACSPFLMRLPNDPDPPTSEEGRRQGAPFLHQRPVLGLSTASAGSHPARNRPVDPGRCCSDSVAEGWVSGSCCLLRIPLPVTVACRGTVSGCWGTSVKGRRAKRTLDAQAPAPRFPRRQAVVSGRGVNPCPEPETRAVLLLGKRSAQAPGIVTRKGGDINPVYGSVSAANRARKGAQPIFELIETFTADTSIELGDRIHELMHMALTADYLREQLESQ